MKYKETKKEMEINGKYKQLKELDKKLYKECKCNLKDFLEVQNKKDKNKEIACYRELIIYILTHTNIKDITIEEIKCYFQRKKSKRNNQNRLKKHVLFYARKNYPIIFGTFTFNEEALKLNPKYRKEIITRELNKNPNIVDYIGNIDFGKLNNREHYHYILICKKDFKAKTELKTITSDEKPRTINAVTNLEINYKKGFTTYELVGNTETDYTKICYYINKLSFHGIKNEKTEHLIYKKTSPYQDYKKKIENRKKEEKEIEEEREKKATQKFYNKIKEIENDYQMEYEIIKNFI